LLHVAHTHTVKLEVSLFFMRDRSQMALRLKDLLDIYPI
jgi:hypothetical protein